jgi:mono/diheme cytochrome c family protein
MRLANAFCCTGLLAGCLAAQIAVPDAGISPEGKKIFVARCAKCHDDNATRKLPDGSNLLDRLAQSKDLKGRIATRIKNPDEQRAVAAYIAQLLAARR